MKATWIERTLGEVIRLEYGKPLDKTDRSPNGRYAVFGANGEIDRTNKFYYNKPSICFLISRDISIVNMWLKYFFITGGTELKY